uniref:Heterogeneous nuclear ribonucleoprotein A0, like n=1 Tax=Gouania willdenowi TaxID=441366 RepID=A0A8C5I5M6_GOUWI
VGDLFTELTSNSHHYNILASLHQLRLRGLLSDVTVQVQHQGDMLDFQAHQAMLAASSGYFKDLFISQHVDANKTQLSNMHPSDFSMFLEFVYTGKVEVPKDKIRDIQAVARFLDCKDLAKVCDEAMGVGIATRAKKILLKKKKKKKKTVAVVIVMKL